MKEILIIFVFLLMIGSAQALIWNCTAPGEIVIVPNITCPAVSCPTCPVLPNETIIIQNLTLPEVHTPNVTCNVDSSGLTTALTDCSKSKDDLSAQYIACDGNLTKGRMYDNELAQKQNDINKCKSDLTKAESDKQTYAMYGVIGTAVVAYILYQQKVKPSAEKRTERE